MNALKATMIRYEVIIYLSEEDSILWRQRK